MKFYHRSSELQQLEYTYKQIAKAARMLVITGRRRIGKTMLALRHTKNKPHLYLFVAKKSERLLCEEYVKQIRQTLEIPVFGEVTEFKDVFALLLEYSKKHPLVLVIDEVQEFLNLNPSVFSDLQCLWDLHKFDSQIQVLFLGSIYSMLQKIFEDEEEPLFGRADSIIRLKPFAIRELYEILCEQGQKNLDLLFDYYMFTGGTPKYIDILLEREAFSRDRIVDCVLSKYSPFLSEGRQLLIQEFGKDYAVYFTILELIAMGKTSRSEIESLIGHTVGGHLEHLEQMYSILEKCRPINAKPRGRTIKYKIKDHFLRFWFRFIHRYRTAVEIENFDYIKRVIADQLPTYSGPVLEQFFQDLFASSGQFNELGSYWERDNKNEIDLVAVNDLDNRLVIAEIKRNKSKISMKELKIKAGNLVKAYPKHQVEFLGLSLEDAEHYL